MSDSFDDRTVHDAAHRATFSVARQTMGGDGPDLDPKALIDNIVPAVIDWRRTVRRWPVASVVAVGVAGFMLGRRRGGAVVTGVKAGLSGAVAERLASLELFTRDLVDDLVDEGGPGGAGMET